MDEVLDYLERLQECLRQERHRTLCHSEFALGQETMVALILRAVREHKMEHPAVGKDIDHEEWERWKSYQFRKAGFLLHHQGHAYNAKGCAECGVPFPEG